MENDITPGDAEASHWAYQEKWPDLFLALSEEVSTLLRDACVRILEEAGPQPDWLPGQSGTSDLRVLWAFENIYLEVAASYCQRLPLCDPGPTYPDGCHFVYRHFTSDDILLYVGYSHRMAARQASHRRTAPWWVHSARMEVEEFPTRDAALNAELVAIRAEQPLWNKFGQLAGRA